MKKCSSKSKQEDLLLTPFKRKLSRKFSKRKLCLGENSGRLSSTPSHPHPHPHPVSGRSEMCFWRSGRFHIPLCHQVSKAAPVCGLGCLSQSPCEMPRARAVCRKLHPPLPSAGAAWVFIQRPWAPERLRWPLELSSRAGPAVSSWKAPALAGHVSVPGLLALGRDRGSSQVSPKRSGVPWRKELCLASLSDLST